jgi:phosphatidylglycerophosphate synthase
VTLVVAARDEALARSLLDDGRLRIPVSIVHDLADGVGTGPALWVSLDVMANATRLRALLATPLDGAIAVVSDAEGPFLADAAIVKTLDGEPLPIALARLVKEGRARSVSLAGWAIGVRDEAGRRRAVRASFEDCRKPLDGLVSRHLNRHVSIFLSKRLVDTKVSPNATTLIAFAFGIGGAALVARGTYVATLAGAALFQVGSILDGVDGELARVRFEHSRTGQWLDTVLDDVANVTFWLCLGLGAPRWLLPFGIVAASANMLAALLSYAELLRVGSGDWYDLGWDVRRTASSGWVRHAVVFAGYVLKKDFFIFFCLCLAIASVLPYALPVLAVGAVVTLASALLRSARLRGVRAPS